MVQEKGGGELRSDQKANKAIAQFDLDEQEITQTLPSAYLSNVDQIFPMGFALRCQMVSGVKWPQLRPLVKLV